VTHLFVYGSLKRGFANHGLLWGQAFVREARTAPGFELVSFRTIPGLIAGRRSIQGEVWAVDDACLRRLDAVEGHPRTYRRTPVPLADGGTAQAYLMGPTLAAASDPYPHDTWHPPRRPPCPAR
jgi:gamma-glutamylcyclotransferase (GGCT)/AIG2-like uncharacterized protein YtfP